MAETWQLTCRTKNPDGSYSYGVLTPNGYYSVMQERDVIVLIDYGKSFCTKSETGRIGEVEVVTQAEGGKYLRTKADGVVSDNLDALPPCT